VGKKFTTRAALLGAVCLPILPALAQDRIDAVRMSFGIDQGFEYGDNLALDTPAEGSSTIATTTLSFGLISETDTQKLDFGISGALQIENTPDTDGTVTDFADPRFTLGYLREGADSELAINANYFSSNIDTLTLDDFINDEGIVVLPEDFSGLQGSGTRSSYGFNIGLDLFQDDPFGLELDAGTSGVDYTGTSDPDLFNYNRTFAGARALLRFSDVLTGTVGLRYSTYDANDEDQTYRTRTTTRVGVIYDISARATLEANLGYTEIETETNDAPTTNRSKPVGNLSYVYAMPNGQITADLDATVDEDGDERVNLQFGRSMELPDGSLSYSLGLTDPEFGSINPIGSLNWTRNLPDGRISAQLSRSVTTDNQDNTQLSTLIVIRYNQNINDVSSFGLTASYGEQDGSEDEDATKRTGIEATYSHALTEDWNLNTGVAYRTFEQNSSGTASSPSIFLSIGRRFDFRP
jgi:hypothetical protein